MNNLTEGNKQNIDGRLRFMDTLNQNNIFDDSTFDNKQKRKRRLIILFLLFLIILAVAVVITIILYTQNTTDVPDVSVCSGRCCTEGSCTYRNGATWSFGADFCTPHVEGIDTVQEG